MFFWDKLPKCIREAVLEIQVFVKSGDVFAMWRTHAMHGWSDEQVADQLRSQAELVRKAMEDARLNGEG